MAKRCCCGASFPGEGDYCASCANLPPLDVFLARIRQEPGVVQGIEDVGGLIEIPSKVSLESFQPHADWFVISPEGIHGIMHESRVLVLAEILGRLAIERGSKVELDVLRYAAITHDVRREDDGPDHAHGGRAAKWMIEHAPIPVQYIAQTSEVVKWHVTHDHAIPAWTKELTIFKDADGLDRWRVKDLNENYLRTNEAVRLMPVSRALYDVSRVFRKHYQSQPFDAVLEAAVVIGLVK